MASVYTNDLRLEEIGSGEQSGSWGDTTNTNLELIAEAFGFGTEAITTNADTHTTTIADGASDPGRAIFLKYTGTLDSACTITLAPNTVSKLWFIENGTSGSQNIILSQGSGANITIPAGQTKAVYSNGAGSGAVMVDAFATLSVVDLLVDDDLTVTDDVAIGGLATVGGTLGVTGVVTANAGVVVDNFTLDGTTLALSSGNFTLDVAGDIILDSDAANWRFKDAGTSILEIGAGGGGGGPSLFSAISDADMIFKGNDGGSAITALTLDMSDAGTATFNHDVKATGNFDLPNANTFITGAGHNVVQVDSTLTYLYGGTGGVQFRTADNASALINISNAGILSTVTAGTSNFRAGVNAGDAIASGGNYNTVVGDEAGTAITTGDANTLIGYTAGAALVGGYNNVAVGKGALNDEVEGRGSTAVGVGALEVQTNAGGTDTLNTAVGFLAGNAVNSGLGNSILGANAGLALSSGNYNTAVGLQALSTETAGAASTAIGAGALQRQILGNSNDSNNVGVGYVAGTKVTTGKNNVLLGRAAYNVTTGNDNISIGTNSLSTESTGQRGIAIGTNALATQNFTSGETSYNVAIGYGAGQSVTTGSTNTFIGCFAGENASTPDSSVFIGFNAGGDAVVTGNQNVLIGENAGKNITSANTSVMIGFNNGDAMAGGGANTSVGSGNAFSSTGVDTEFIYGRNATGGGASTMTIGNGDTDATLAIDGSDTSWAAASDLRLKKNIVTSTAGLSFIKELRPIQYEWKNKGEVDSSITKYHETDSTEPCRGVGGTFHGFVAQEVKTAIDNHASQFSDKHNIWRERVDGIQSVSPGNLVPMLVKAIQELEARIATLEG